jgi:hypothetical protein
MYKIPPGFGVAAFAGELTTINPETARAADAAIARARRAVILLIQYSFQQRYRKRPSKTCAYQTMN